MRGGLVIEEVETLTVEETAKMLNVYPENIRMGLQTERYPFGVAIQSEGKIGRWNYIIIKAKFDEYLEMQKNTKDKN